MKDNTKLLTVAVFIMLFEAFVLFYQNKVINEYKFQLERQDTLVIKDTVFNTIVFNDTLTLTKTNTIIKTDTFYTNTGDTVKIDLKKKEYTNTLIQQEDTVEYHAYLTGRSLETEDYPILDSINIQTNKRIINTTTIIEKERPKKLKLIVTPTITGGYDIYNHQWGIMAGIGIGVTRK